MSEQDKNTPQQPPSDAVTEAAQEAASHTEQAQPQSSTMPPPVGHEAVSQDSKNLAILVWLGSLLFSFIPGFIVLLVKNDDPWLKEQAKENLNFSISYLLYFIGCMILSVAVIGALLLPVLGIAYLIFIIIGTVKASEGSNYQVPFIFRVLK